MDCQLQVFLSNQTEVLYERLKERLFAQDADPFTTRVVVVPSKAMKHWLSLRFARDLGISAGIEFLFLESALRQLKKRLIVSEDPFQLPCRMELALHIEKEVRRSLQDETDEICKPLRDYLFDAQRGRLTKKGEIRIVHLSDQLATLFARYEKYGSEMLQRWEKKESTDWQEVLWRRVVGRVAPRSLPWNSGKIAVHLFALIDISKGQHRLFCDLSERIPVDYYLLSPCELFWSDLLSDKGNSRLIRYWENQGMSLEALNEATELLFDRNPLLANWGRLGRLMAAQIEESMVPLEDHYVEHSEESTCLKALQTDLLKLRNGKFLSQRNVDNDDSIQIHLSTSKMREVQVLYQTLLGIIERHQKDQQPIAPSDMIVMAPDIDLYAPIIRAVFQSSQSELDCQIIDGNRLDQCDVIQGFFHLLTIVQSRWDNKSVLNLFFFSSFQKKHRLTQAEVEMIARWMKEGEIKWGIDGEHRSALLQAGDCEKGMLDRSMAGTWKMGIERLLLGMAMILPDRTRENGGFDRRPACEVSVTNQQLLGEWTYLIRSLKKDLYLLEVDKRMSLEEWSAYFMHLLDRYFSWNEISEEQMRGVSALIESIEMLKHVDLEKEDLYPFTTVIFHLKKVFEEQKGGDREHTFQAVRFCSMVAVRGVPARVICMMGVSEDYPKKEQKSALNQLYTQQGVDPFPTTTEFDRYLFLEALLSAREYLLFSYHQKKARKQPLQECSLLISELVHYLDQSLTIDGAKPSETFPFDHSLVELPF